MEVDEICKWNEIKYAIEITCAIFKARLHKEGKGMDEDEILGMMKKRNNYKNKNQTK